jgi:hypothetical protein
MPHGSCDPCGKSWVRSTAICSHLRLVARAGCIGAAACAILERVVLAKRFDHRRFEAEEDRYCGCSARDAL